MEADIRRLRDIFQRVIYAVKILAVVPYAVVEFYNQAAAGAETRNADVFFLKVNGKSVYFNAGRRQADKSLDYF